MTANLKHRLGGRYNSNILLHYLIKIYVNIRPVMSNRESLTTLELLPIAPVHNYDLALQLVECGWVSKLGEIYQPVSEVEQQELNSISQFSEKQPNSQDCFECNIDLLPLPGEEIEVDD